VSLIPLSLETLKDLDGGRPSLAFSHEEELPGYQIYHGCP
jgi:hypothetical protein